MTFLSLTAPEVVKMLTTSVDGDGDVIKVRYIFSVHKFHNASFEYILSDTLQVYIDIIYRWVSARKM